jgi:hypothetical protein
LNRRRPASEPQVEPVIVEPCWTLVGPEATELTCAIYRHVHGVEVRCGFAKDVMHTEYAASVESARIIAVEWRRALLENGIFTVA